MAQTVIEGRRRGSGFPVAMWEGYRAEAIIAPPLVMAPIGEPAKPAVFTYYHLLSWEKRWGQGQWEQT
jgi:hypothetical protein